MDLGNLNWSVEVDTSDLSRAESEMEGTREVATEGQRAVDKFGNSISKADKAAGRYVDSAGKMREANGRFVTGANKARKATDGLSSGLGGVRRAAQLAASALAAIGVTAGIGNAIRQIADFQAAMNGLAAVSGATADQMARLEEQARTLGATSQFSAQQAAEGQRFLAQAGFSVNEVMGATPGILRLATAGQLDLASAADIASNVLGGMRMEASELNRVNDVLAATASRSNTNIRQLGQALSFAAPFAAGAGVSIEEAAAAIGNMSDAGIQASRAGTGLVGTIRQLSNVTDSGQEVLSRYGLSVADVNIEARGLGPVLEALRSAGLNTADSIALFGSEAGAAAQVLVNDYNGAIRDAAGESERMANQIEQGLGPAFRSFGSAVSESILLLGDSGLAGALEGLVRTTTGVISVWNGMGDEWAEANDVGEETLAVIEGIADALQIMAVMAGARAVQAIGSLIAAKAGLTAGTLTLTGALTGLRTVLATLFGPVGLIAGAVAALYTFREELGLVDDSAGNAERAIRASSDAIRDGGKTALDTSYESLNLELENLSLKAQEAMTRMLELNRMQEFYNDSHLGMSEQISQQASQQEKLLADLWDQMIDIQSAQERNRKRREELTQAEEDGAKATDELIEKTEELASETEKSATEVASLSDELNRLRSRIQPGYAEAQRFAQGLNTVNIALAAGRISLGEYAELVSLLQQEMQGAEQSIEDVADTNTDATDEMTREWERFGNSVDETFKDAFKGAFDSFEDFADQLKNAFENLLAELAYAAVKNEIRIQLGMQTSGPMQGGISSLMGGQGGGFGGIGRLVQGADKLLGTDIYGSVGNALGIGSSIGAAGTAATGYAGAGWASSVATGGYTGWAGSAAAGSTAAGGGLMSTVGAAMPWIGGVMALDGIFDIGIMDGIGKAIGSGLDALGLGHEKTPFRGEFVTRESQFDAAGMTRNDRVNAMRAQQDQDFYFGGYYAQSALGDLGLTHSGSQRVHRAQDMDAGRDAADWAWQLAESAAQMDNLVVTLARSDDDVQAMADAVQSLHIRSGNASKIIEHALVDRPLAALDAVGIEISQRFRNMDAEQFAVEFEQLVQVTALVANGAERLNLQFDVTANNALVATENIMHFAGGLDNLSALQSSYYQAFFTDAERAAHLQDDLTHALSSMGMQLPDTRDGFRALVEAQDLNSEAGQRNYVALLQLAGGFDQLQQHLESLGEAGRSAAEIAREREGLERALLRLQGDTLELRRREAAELDPSNRALQERIWSIQDQEQAVSDANRAMDAAMGGLRDAYRQVEQAVQAEQQMLQEAHQETTASIQDNMASVQDAMTRTDRLAGSLQSTLDSMMGASSAGQQSQFETASDYLRSVLAGGGLGDPDELDRALSAVANPSQDTYETLQDYQRDFLSAAHVVDQLNDRADGQLTTQQRSLRALERQLDQADRQFEREMTALDGVLERQAAQLEAEFGQLGWLQNINDSVLSIGDAIVALGGAVDSAISAREAASKATSAANRAPGSSRTQEEILAGALYNEANPDVSAAVGAGVFDTPREHYEKYGRAEGREWPGFANGGDHSGGYRIVGERGPELEYTGPSRITSNNDIMRLNDELTAEVKQLREDLRQVMRPIAESTGRSADTLEEWNYGGKPPVREEVDA